MNWLDMNLFITNKIKNEFSEISKIMLSLNRLKFLNTLFFSTLDI